MPTVPQQDVSEHAAPAQWRSTPITPGATLLFFDPALAIEIGETKAIVLQKVWDWMEYNRLNNKWDHCIDGQWYSYNSAKEWRDNHFWYLSVATVKKVFQELEKEGYLQRIQHHKHRGDCRPWVTIPASARALIDAISAANTPEEKYPRGDKNAPTGDKNVPPLGEKVSPTKKNLQTENLQTKTANPNQQQHADTTAAAVGPLDLPDPEAESGEHSLDGEGHDTTAVKAFVPHEQHHDKQPFPKVPPKGFPVLAGTARDLATTLAALYAAYNLTDDYAAQLIGRYGEDHVRACHQHVQDNWRQFPAPHKSRIFNPPGFMTDELAVRRLNLDPVPAVAVDSDSDTDGVDSGDLGGDITAEDQVCAEEPTQADDAGDPLDEKAVEVWRAARHQLMSKNVEFERWLNEAALRGYQSTESGVIYRVAVTHAQAQDQLQHRYYRAVAREFNWRHDRPVTIEFEVVR